MPIGLKNNRSITSKFTQRFHFKNFNMRSDDSTLKDGYRFKFSPINIRLPPIPLHSHFQIVIQEG